MTIMMLVVCELLCSRVTALEPGWLRLGIDCSDGVVYAVVLEIRH